jgi:hypothetical protein
LQQALRVGFERFVALREQRLMASSFAELQTSLVGESDRPGPDTSVKR